MLPFLMLLTATTSLYHLPVTQVTLYLIVLHILCSLVSLTVIASNKRQSGIMRDNWPQNQKNLGSRLTSDPFWLYCPRQITGSLGALGNKSQRRSRHGTDWSSWLSASCAKELQAHSPLSVYPKRMQTVGWKGLFHQHLAQYSAEDVLSMLVRNNSDQSQVRSGRSPDAGGNQSPWLSASPKRGKTFLFL